MISNPSSMVKKSFFNARNVILILLAIILFFVVAKKAGWIGKDPGTKVAVEVVSPKTIVETVTASGKIQPETQVKISPDVSGEIIELNVKEGDKVRKGDLLCKIRQDNYLSILERTNAGVNGAKANLANAEARVIQANVQLTNNQSVFNRQKKLFEQNAISQQEFDASKAAYDNAKAEVDAAKQNVKAAEFNVKNAEATSKEAADNLGKTVIFAPVDGLVSKLNVEQGERVVGTSQMAGTEIMTIANVSEMEVNVEVNENDIIRVELGDTAEIDVDAYLDKKFLGIVTEIANSATSSMSVSADQVTNFPVKVRILRESYADLIPKGKDNYSPFRPGMTATVEVRTNRASNVLAVPVQSVTTREDTASYGVKDEKKDFKSNVSDEEQKKTQLVENPKQYVFVHENGFAKLREVTTGIQDNNNIHILSGLKAGEEVIAAPYKAISKVLKNKTPVSKVDKEELYAGMKEEEE
jgi:HlyD family secretion protein